MTQDELLTSRQVARELKVTQRTVLREIERGHFPDAFKAGWAWRIPRSDLRAYIEKRRGRQVSAPE